MRRLLRYLCFVISMSNFFATPRYSHQSCGLYGQPPCTFVPSPSGVTPICATPGRTYCEQAHEYPIHIIRRLIEKLGYDKANHLIVDETLDEFDDTKTNLIPQNPNFVPPGPFPSQGIFPSGPGNGPSQGNVPGQGNYPGHPGQNLPGHGKFPSQGGFPLNHNYPSQDPYPASGVPQNGVYNPTGEGYSYPNPNKVLPPNSYIPPANNIPPSHNEASPVHYSIEHNSPLWHDYRQKRPQHYDNRHPHTHWTHNRPTYYFKRYARDTSRQEMAGAGSMNATSGAVVGGRSGERKRRQSPGRFQLCDTRFQYITPQAALNSQGNWMFVVNQVDNARQLVRTETCASSVCNGICQLPNGYSSRCEQKYVQKRLIALNGDGTELYTDTFWFPSCCACTLARN